ncbi:MULTISPECIES: hypothetical protein [unclassified Streptomyces]|uniref:hypothetical protein n=1 Tax=unclassified Streptomyces TaxID=2593676 RepID=UPI002E2ACFE5|nr:hypothetical protein [Streptomyces sp. NBC_00223]
MKYVVREKMFAIGDDYWIEDESGRRAFFVDGKVLRLRENRENTDASMLIAIAVCVDRLVEREHEEKEHGER